MGLGESPSRPKTRYLTAIDRITDGPDAVIDAEALELAPEGCRLRESEEAHEHRLLTQRDSVAQPARATKHLPIAIRNASATKIPGSSGSWLIPATV